MTSRRTFLGMALVLGTSAAATLIVVKTGSGPATAQSSAVFTKGGLAVSGYDPVAYFTESKPVKGNPAITLDHGGAKYQFSSDANRDSFRKDPDKYVPQYGGFCSWAVSHGYTADADPLAWSIHEGKLYLNINRSVHRSWIKDQPANIARADLAWPKVMKGK